MPPQLRTPKSKKFCFFTADRRLKAIFSKMLVKTQPSTITTSFSAELHFGYISLIKISDLLRKQILIICEAPTLETRKINWSGLSEKEKIEVLKQGRIHLQEQVEYARFCACGT